MRRLTVYLDYVKPEAGKIINTISYVVKNDRQISDCLALNEGNIKKYTFSNIK